MSEEGGIEICSDGEASQEYISKNRIRQKKKSTWRKIKRFIHKLKKKERELHRQHKNFEKEKCAFNNDMCRHTEEDSFNGEESRVITLATVESVPFSEEESTEGHNAPSEMMPFSPIIGYDTDCGPKNTAEANIVDLKVYNEVHKQCHSGVNKNLDNCDKHIGYGKTSVCSQQRSSEPRMTNDHILAVDVQYIRRSCSLSVDVQFGNKIQPDINITVLSAADTPVPARLSVCGENRAQEDPESNILSRESMRTSYLGKDKHCTMGLSSFEDNDSVEISRTTSIPDVECHTELKNLSSMPKSTETFLLKEHKTENQAVPEPVPLAEETQPKVAIHDEGNNKEHVSSSYVLSSGYPMCTKSSHIEGNCSISMNSVSSQDETQGQLYSQRSQDVSFEQPAEQFTEPAQSPEVEMVIDSGFIQTFPVENNDIVSGKNQENYAVQESVKKQINNTELCTNATESAMEQVNDTELCTNATESAMEQINDTELCTNATKSAMEQINDTELCTNATESAMEQVNDIELCTNATESANQHINDTELCTNVTESAMEQVNDTELCTNATALSNQEINNIELCTNATKSAMEQINDTELSANATESANQQINDTELSTNATESAMEQINDTELCINATESANQQMNDTELCTNATESAKEQVNDTELCTNVPKSANQQINDTELCTNATESANQQINDTELCTNATESSMEQVNDIEQHANVAKVTYDQANYTLQCANAEESTKKQTHDDKLCTDNTESANSEKFKMAADLIKPYEDIHTRIKLETSVTIDIESAEKTTEKFCREDIKKEVYDKDNSISYLKETMEPDISCRECEHSAHAWAGDRESIESKMMLETFGTNENSSITENIDREISGTECNTLNTDAVADTDFCRENEEIQILNGLVISSEDNINPLIGTHNLVDFGDETAEKKSVKKKMDINEINDKGTSEDLISEIEPQKMSYSICILDSESLNEGKTESCTSQYCKQSSDVDIPVLQQHEIQKTQTDPRNEDIEGDTVTSIMSDMKFVIKPLPHNKEKSLGHTTVLEANSIQQKHEKEQRKQTNIYAERKIALPIASHVDDITMCNDVYDDLSCLRVKCKPRNRKRNHYFCKYCHRSRREPNRNCKLHDLKPEDKDKEADKHVVNSEINVHSKQSSDVDIPILQQHEVQETQTDPLNEDIEEDTVTSRFVTMPYIEFAIRPLPHNKEESLSHITVLKANSIQQKYEKKQRKQTNMYAERKTGLPNGSHVDDCISLCIDVYDGLPCLRVKCKPRDRKRNHYFCKYCHRSRRDPNRNCKLHDLKPEDEDKETDKHVVNSEINSSLEYSEIDSGIVVSYFSSTVSTYMSLYDSVKEKLHHRTGRNNKFPSPRIKRELESYEQEVRHIAKYIASSWSHFTPNRYSLHVAPGLASYFNQVENGNPPSRQQSLAYEWIRFQSFDRYTGNGSGIVLARNGFYHDNENGPTATRCYACDATYCDWSYFDNPRERHNSNCPHVHGSSSENIPIHGEEPEGRERNTTGPSPTRVSPSNTGGIAQASPGTSLDRNQRGETGTNSENQETVDVIATSLESTNIDQQAGESQSLQPTEDRENNQYMTSFVVSFLNESDSSGNTEHKRTASLPNRQSPEAPSNHGEVPFTLPDYTFGPGAAGGKNDQQVPSTSSAPGVRASESQSTAPNEATTTTQATVTSQPSTVNESRTRNQLAASGQPVDGARHPARALAQATESRRACETIGHIETHPELIIVTNPKYPDHVSIDARIASFTGWPDNLDQTPRRMAEAGFFFTKVADFTRCYACGGGLRNWEAGDDPVTEHTRWYPTCPHVTKLKGERYVEAVKVKQQQHLEERRKQQQTLSQRRAAQPGPPDPLRTTTASVLTELGYAQSRIRDAILAVRAQHGRTDVSAEEVLVWILDDDDRRSAIAAQRAADAGSFRAPHTSQSVEVSSSSSSSSAPTSNSAVSSTQQQSGETRSMELGSNGGQVSESAGTSGSQSGNGDDTSERGGSPKAGRANGKSGRKKRRGRKGGEKAKTPTEGATGSSSSMSLLADTDSLREENEMLKEIQTCKVCMDKPVCVTFLPCGHLVCCEDCAPRLRKCPICRKNIRGNVKTFMS